MIRFSLQHLPLPFIWATKPGENTRRSHIAHGPDYGGTVSMISAQFRCFFHCCATKRAQLYFACLTTAVFAFAPSAIASSPGEIFRIVLPSVVTIVTDKHIGSGFFIEDGHLVVTNNHVISGARTFGIRTADGTELSEINIHAIDAARDLAILRVPFQGPPLRLNRDDPEIGSNVYVIGAPRGFSNSLSAGLVSVACCRFRGHPPKLTGVPRVWRAPPSYDSGVPRGWRAPPSYDWSAPGLASTSEL